MTRILALLPTIPARRASCERLLGELARQCRPPAGVILVLDGYGEAAAPICRHRLFVHRTAVPSGPGVRWRATLRLVAEGVLDEDDVLVVLDDDITLCEAPRFFEALVAAMEKCGGAAGAQGRLADGTRAAPGSASAGRLIYACGAGLAVRVGHLADLLDLAAEVRGAGGPDALGMLGDDDALVSAHLWRRGVPIWHAAAGNYYSVPGSQDGSQSKLRLAREGIEDQKKAIARITGWPWPGFR